MVADVYLLNLYPGVKMGIVTNHTSAFITRSNFMFVCLFVYQMVATGNADFLEYNIYLTRGWGPNMVSSVIY